MPTARSGLSSLKTNGTGYVAISEISAVNSEHIVIRDKQENFGIYKVADGREVWNQAGVKRFSLTKNIIALCKSDGVEIWGME